MTTRTPTLTPIAAVAIGTRFRLDGGREGILVRLSPSSAIVRFQEAPRVASFTDRLGQRRKFRASGLSKPKPISLGTLVEPLAAL